MGWWRPRMKSLYILAISTFCIVLSPITGHADAIWNPSMGSIYHAKKHFKRGDIITIHIAAQATAVHQAGTNTSKKSTISTQLYNIHDDYNLRSGGNSGKRYSGTVSLGGGDDYRGLGQTSRKSNVKATISAVVTEVLENGNLVIMGQHTVNINNETEVIMVSGIVRPQDIKEDNSVKSHQIAQTQISVKGEGVVGSKQSPGIVSQMMNWLF